MILPVDIESCPTGVLCRYSLPGSQPPPGDRQGHQQPHACPVTAIRAIFNDKSCLPGRLSTDTRGPTQAHLPLKIAHGQLSASDRARSFGRGHCGCPVSANFPFCHSIVLVGHHLPLNFPRTDRQPNGVCAAVQRAGRMVMLAGLLPEQSSLAQATPAQRKNRANRASWPGCFVIQDSSPQVTGPS
jgi:hypothetical protein